MFMIPNVEKIIQLRTDVGLSQHQLSLKAGLAGNSIYRIESKSTSSIHRLRAKEIAKALGCKVSDIFEKQ